MIDTYNIKVKSYVDNMDSELQNELAAWPFRYYIIDYDSNDLNDSKSKVYKFRFIPDPSDSEYDLEILFDKLNN
jgi:hypothetical protein